MKLYVITETYIELDYDDAIVNTKIVKTTNNKNKAEEFKKCMEWDNLYQYDRYPTLKYEIFEIESNFENDCQYTARVYGYLNSPSNPETRLGKYDFQNNKKINFKFDSRGYWLEIIVSIPELKYENLENVKNLWYQYKYQIINKYKIENKLAMISEKSAAETEQQIQDWLKEEEKEI